MNNKKCSISAVLCIFVLCVFFAPTVSATNEWDGEGTVANPYVISNEADLHLLTESVFAGNTYNSECFQLSNDISLSKAWSPIGTKETPFCGKFDGNGYTISGMTVDGDYSGFFAYIGSGATITNVNLSDVSVTGIDYLAGLVVCANAGNGSISILNCSVDGNITDIGPTDNYEKDSYVVSDYIGGIVAYASAENGSISISGCCSHGTYTCDDYAGGIVGYGQGTGQSLAIINCTNNAYINADDNSNMNGGIAGYLVSAKVENCMNYGSVYGNSYSEDNGSSYLSGIAGKSSSTTFIGCGNYGSVGTFFAAGISSGYDDTYISCLNAGELIHSSDGYGVPIGKVGSSNIFSNCYFSESGKTYYFMQDHSETGTEITENSISAIEAAYYLKDYFGLRIGVNSVPVPKNSDNCVYKVIVIGAVNKTYYVNSGSTIKLSACATYDDGTSTVDSYTPITQDLALIASNANHTFTDGICSVCGEAEMTLTNLGRCGENALWSINARGVLTIYGSGNMSDFANSSSVPWHDYATTINTIAIEKGITSIGNYAFAGFTSLSNITGGETLVSIGEYSFNDCDSITTYKVPANIKYIGSNAFSSCDALRQISLGYSVETIGNKAFENCITLDSFYSSIKLTSIGSYAFYGCTELDYIQGLSNMVSIGSYAFAECTTVKDIKMGNVKSIGDHAFSGCTSLSYVTFTGNAPESIDSTAFHNCKVICVFSPTAEGWVESIRKDYGGALTWVIGAGVSGNLSWAISTEGNLIVSGSGTMYNYSSPSRVPWYSLRDQINAVDIYYGVTSIGESAFYYCTNLTSIFIPESVKSIGDYAFCGCEEITSVTIPDSVTKIGKSAFNNCNNLENVYFTGTEEEWNNISITSYNDPLLNATIHFNYKLNQNANSNIVDSAYNNNTVTTHIDINDIKTRVNIYVALYDVNNKLQGIYTEKIVSDVKNKEITFNDVSLNAQYTIKVMLWDDNIVPACSATAKTFN